MRITIKSLQEKLAECEVDKKRYYTLWQEAKNEIEKKHEWKIVQRDAEENSARREVGNLMQIIRILAKDPTLTMPTMNQEEFRHR